MSLSFYIQQWSFIITWCCLEIIWLVYRTYLWSNQWQSFTKCSHHLCLILVCDWLQPRLTMCGVLLLNSEWWFECWVLLWWGAGREEIDCVLCCVGYFKCLVCELGVPRLIPRVLANRMYISICPNEFHLLIVAQCNVKWEWDGFFDFLLGKQMEGKLKYVTNTG